MELYDLAMHEMQARLKAGDVSAEALAIACLRRIADTEGRVRAFVTRIDAEAVLAQARQHRKNDIWHVKN
ncbi:MAG: hypothetical protein Q4B48_07780, partial [Syntrophomonadaceae bacterium]|nr:hypothetical protein [Syntrophomonadaceae bacterium]